MSRILYTTLLAIGLASCTTTPTEIKLYSLSLPEPFNAVEKNSAVVDIDKPILQIASVKLADYLNTRSLIIQTNQYQINNASYHLWAEDLDKAIAKSLLEKLKPLNNRLISVNNSVFQKEKPHFLLQLEFSAFHTTDQSQVISKGKYWIYDNAHKLILLKDFTYALTLEKDGYLHSIDKLNETLNLLAADIISSTDF
jgi:uncharacterized lipoprotein YmbA